MCDIKYLLFGSLLIVLSGCKTDRESVIRDFVDERVSDHTRKEYQKCRENLLQKASAIADSILLTEATTAAQDSLSERKPWRPVPPPPLEPIDSGPVRPIFNDNVDH